MHGSTHTPRTPEGPEFVFRDGELHVEDVPLSRIAAAVGTPVYCYSSAALTRRFTAFATAFAGQDTLICYAVKANGNLAVIRTLAALGAGADVVSEGELRRALAAGVAAEKIIFSGVGKHREEIAFALDSGIWQINIESPAELDILGALTVGRPRPIEIAVRVNPDVDAETHAKITTGRAENKFGIDIEHAGDIFARAAALPGVAPVAVAVHIGSQLVTLAPFRQAFTRIAALVRGLRAEGHNIRRIDIGGGLGITYRDETPPDIADYAALVAETLGALGCTIVLEPGRALVGNAGVLLSRVLYLKDGARRRFVIVDAAMNDLGRPSIYGAQHEILPVAEPAADTALAPADVVGPVCETGDSFAEGRPLPPLAADDLIVICSAGAYGAVMASSYNSRLLVPEVLVRGDGYAVVRPRQSHDDMLAAERLPEWLPKAMFDK